MRAWPARWWVSLPLAALLGCANLEARKVPVSDRLDGTDDKIKGFRYYVSRPYLIVSRRVCVGQHLAVGRLLWQKDGPETVIETIDEHGRPRYYDSRGAETLIARDQYVAVEYLKPAPQPVKDPKTGMGGGTGKGGGTGDDTKKEEEKKDGDMKDKKDGAPLADIRVEALQRRLMLADQLRQTLVADTSQTAPDAFQFVMLPDFEEQVAVKDVNFAAYGKYELKFADGWQLRSVSGTWDSTEVAIKALQVLSNAVSAAAEVRSEQLTKLPVKRPGADVTSQAVGQPVYAVRVVSTYIEPGVYRLQKTSEKTAVAPDAGAACPEGGLLSDLGIPVVTDVRVQLVTP